MFAVNSILNNFQKFHINLQSKKIIHKIVMNGGMSIKKQLSSVLLAEYPKITLWYSLNLISQAHSVLNFECINLFIHLSWITPFLNLNRKQNELHRLTYYICWIFLVLQYPFPLTGHTCLNNTSMYCYVLLALLC